MKKEHLKDGLRKRAPYQRWYGVKRELKNTKRKEIKHILQLIWQRKLQMKKIYLKKNGRH